MSYRVGDPVIWRSLPGDVVGTVKACRVVRDDADLTALTILPGYPFAQRSGVRGGPDGRQLLEWDGGYRERTWHTNRVLILYRAGDAHSVELLWREIDDAFLGWHVNLQVPWRRTRLGFDSRDLILDVFIDPRRVASWKDEDELAFALGRGTISEREVAIARAEGERAMERAARREPPFDDSWLEWRPDPSWTPPALPPGWERVDAV
jgi:hypothetical protein